MRRAKWLGGLLLTGLLLSAPQAAATGAARAAAYWYMSVAPAVFPFLALMPLLTCEDAALAYEKLLGRAMGRLFKLPGAAASAMVIGMVAGTPAGAIAARRVAARSGMDRGQLWRLAVAAMGFSPAFLIGGIGAGMLGSAAMGWRLACAQLMTQLTMALLLRRAWPGATEPVADGGTIGGDAPVRGAVLAALTICGYMALFGAITAAAGKYLGRKPSYLLLCLMDVPSGARLVSEWPMEARTRLVLLAAMVGFGGLCAIAQGLGALKDCGLNPVACLALRGLAALLNAGYMALLMCDRNTPRLVVTARANPLAAAGLCAALMALPVLIKMRKSIS